MQGLSYIASIYILKNWITDCECLTVPQKIILKIKIIYLSSKNQNNKLNILWKFYLKIYWTIESL